MEGNIGKKGVVLNICKKGVVLDVSKSAHTSMWVYFGESVWFIYEPNVLPQRPKYTATDNHTQYVPSETSSLLMWSMKLSSCTWVDRMNISKYCIRRIRRCMFRGRL